MNIDDILKKVLKRIESSSNIEELKKISTEYLGRKGIITKLLRNISLLNEKDRPIFGKNLNKLKKNINLALNKALSEIKVDKNTKMIDVTLPGKIANIKRGYLHPISQIMFKICSIFLEIGFTLIDGPEIETDYYNFEALNLPKNHPARDMQDSFYISDNFLLRTQMTSTQPRIMEIEKPPLQVIAAGKVYRCDFDLTHTPMFHQVEGLFVDYKVSFSDLKGLMKIFIFNIFGENIDIRFRPSYFPFTEPSAELDIKCVICSGKGCKVCSQTGWLEILGCGMVHPSVFIKSGYFSYFKEGFTGFAFGMGVERIAMLKYHISDIRTFFDNDFRLLSQF